MLRPFAHPVACCCTKFETGQTFQSTTPNISLFRDRRSERWIRLHSCSNIVGATHAHYAWITKTYGLYPSHGALQVPNLLGVVASVCTPLPTRTQQLPTLLAQQCWEFLRPFARSLRVCFAAALVSRMEARARLHSPSLNLKKKRDCSPSSQQIES